LLEDSFLVVVFLTYFFLSADFLLLAGFAVFWDTGFVIFLVTAFTSLGAGFTSLGAGLTAFKAGFFLSLGPSTFKTLPVFLST